MNNFLKIFYFKLFIYFLLILISFLSLKFSLIFGIFIYPYVLYKVCREYNLAINFLFGFITGVSFVLALFYWFNSSGLILTLILGSLVGLTFAFTLLFSKIIFDSFKINLFMKFLTIPIIFTWFKFILIQKTLRVEHLLEVPIFLTYFYQFIDSTGVILILMFFSISIGHFIEIKKWKSVLILISILLCLIILNSFLINLNDNSSEKYVNVGVVQGNFNENYTYRLQNSLGLIYDYYINESINIVENQNAEIVIWPEYALLNDITNNQKVREEIEGVTNDNNFSLVFGSFEELGYGRYDLANIVFSNRGFQEPYKSRIPFRDISNGSRFLAGEKPILYGTGKGNFLILICYEELFHNLIEDYDLSKVDYIVIISNNQLVGSEFGFDTLLWNMQYIGAKYRKYVVSATNTGPSAIVDDYGRIIEIAKYNSQTSFVGKVPLNIKKESFYYKNGEFFVLLVLLTYFWYIAYKVIRRRK